MLFDLFVALLIEVYTSLRDTRAKTAFLSTGQRVWVKNMRTLLAVRLPPPSKPRPTRFAAFDAVRVAVFAVTLHPAFEIVILAVIVINVVFMCIGHAGEDQRWLTAQDVAGAVFTAIFGLEVVLKLVALGFRLYFASWSNRFDFALAAGSVAVEAINLPPVGSKFRRRGRVWGAFCCPRSTFLTFSHLSPTAHLPCFSTLPVGQVLPAHEPRAVHPGFIPSGLR